MIRRRLARLRQLTLEQRVESIGSVVRAVVSDLTDAEVDFEKTVFDNGMHSTPWSFSAG